MSEMIERVARALCVEDDENPDEIINVGKPRWWLYNCAARAAIEAIREPTEGMLDAAREVTKGQSFFANYPRKIDAMVHRAMIDAALK